MTNERACCEQTALRIESALDRLRDEITQLRGNLSLAEEGLANAMQDIERLHQKDRIKTHEINILTPENRRQAAEIERLRSALLDLYNGTAEYVYLNNLGDPHNTTPMRRASEVLGVAYPRSLKPAHEPCEQRTMCGAKCTFLYSCDLAPGHVGQHADRRSGKWIEWDDPTPEKSQGAPRGAGSGDFDKDLAHLDYLRAKYDSRSVDVTFLLSFIDNLWREYSRASKCVRCGDLCQLPLAAEEGIACELATGHEGNHKRGGWSWIRQ